MSDFKYVAMTADGKSIKGAIEASDVKDAANKIRQLGYMPVEIKEGMGLARYNVFGAFLGRVRSDDLMMLYVQLHDMMDAGINLLTSIESISEQTRNKRLKSVLRSVIEDIRKGKSFSYCLEQHPAVFPDLLVNMIKSGESSGKMNAVLGSYITLYEEQLELKEKVLTALFYPLILLLVGAAIALFLVTFTIPKFVVIFSDAGITMPFLTKALFIVGTGITRYWYLMIIGIILVILGIRSYARTVSGRRNLDAFKLALPLMGTLNRNVMLSRFSVTMAMLIRSGVPMMRSLELNRAVMQNVIMEDAITAVASGVEKGESLAVMMMRSGGRFPANMIQLVMVGEETGNLDGMLEKAGAFYNKAVTNMVKRLTVVIEPVFLIIMGATVGMIMASILMPLFKMIDIAMKM